jgi:hypothetical protein
LNYLVIIVNCKPLGTSLMRVRRGARPGKMRQRFLIGWFLTSVFVCPFFWGFRPSDFQKHQQASQKASLPSIFA